MFYFLYYSYVPNTASFNRALSYFRSLDKFQVHATIVFLMPDARKNKLTEEFKYVEVKYLWDKCNIHSSYLKYLSYYINCSRFLSLLKKGDAVYIDGLEKISKKVLKKPGVKLFIESTECPEVYSYLNPIHETKPNEFIDICKKADGLFVISTGLKDYYSQKGVDRDRIHIINMTVDPSRFSDITNSEPSQKYIAYCGTVSNNKDGVDHLIKAYGIFAKSHPEVKLYIIGNVPSKEEECGNLQLIKELGLEENIVLTGLVSAERMPQLLKDASLLALARPDNIQAKYGFPTKLGEYLMTENPVVVTTVGDIPLFLEDGNSALMAPPEDDSAFAEKMVWAIENPEESNKIGKRGRLVAEQSFNAGTETKKMIKIMESSSIV